MSHPTKISWEDVVLYLEGDISDQEEVARIEQARERDPEVAELFEQVVSDFSPSDDALAVVQDMFRRICQRPAETAVRQAEKESTHWHASESELQKGIADATTKLMAAIDAWTLEKAPAVSRAMDSLWQPLGAHSWAPQGGVRAAEKVDPDAPVAPVNAGDVVELREGRVYIELPASEAPFAVARILVLRRLDGDDDSTVLLGTRMIPLARVNGERVGSELIASWIAGIPISQILCQVVLAQDDPHILQLFPAPEVETLFADPRVMENDALRADVERLIDALRQHQERQR